MDREEKINRAIKFWRSEAVDRGYDLIYIGLYGSQNYELDIYTDEYQSDTDFKAIVIPSLDDLLNNKKPVSETVRDEYFGDCDFKDIRLFVKLIEKGNPHYIESLCSKYRWLNYCHYSPDFLFLTYFIDSLKSRIVKAIRGVALEKYYALSHPYPSKVHLIKKYGYDGKQLHHLIRLERFLYEYAVVGKTFSECLVPHPLKDDDDIMQKLIDSKLNRYSLETAQAMAKEHLESINKIVQNIQELEEQNLDTINFDIHRAEVGLDRECAKAIKSKIKDDIKGEILNGEY